VAGVILGLLARAEAALNYEPGRGPVYRAHAGFKIAALAIAWTALLVAWDPWEMAGALVYPVLIAVMAGRRILPAVQLSLVAAGFVGGAALVISPYPFMSWEWAWRAAALALRVFGLALATTATFTTTHPLMLASTLARAPFLHDFTLVYYRVVPLTVQDLEMALAVQGLHGGGVKEALTATTLVSYERARSLELSLASKGMDRGGRRTGITGPGDPAVGLLLLLVSLAGLLAVIAA